MRIAKTGAAIDSGLILTLVLTGGPTRPANKNQKAFYADESCVVCHGSGATFDVSKVHAQF